MKINTAPLVVCNSSQSLVILLLGQPHPSEVSCRLKDFAQVTISFGKKLNVLSRDDELFRHNKQRLDFAAFKSMVGDDGRASVLEARQWANFNAIEGNAMKGCPCREGVNWLLEPPVGPAGTDHAGVTTAARGSNTESAITPTEGTRQ
jgi:hypothetical protein